MAEPLYMDQGATWAALAPLIQARQREIAASTSEQIAAVRETDASANRASLLRDSVRALRDQGTAEDKRAPGELSDAEQEVVADMAARDAEVRRHEEAHARVGGQYASAPSYSYQTGPDGKNYAIGGEVQIDVAPIDGDPAATIVKMDTVKAAALAPAEPSAADRQVASLADRQRGLALAELNALRTAEMSGETTVDTRV